MTRDDVGREVMFFGRWYYWHRNGAGNLSLISAERLQAAVAELAASVRKWRSEQS